MPIPDATVEIQDGALGLLPENANNVVALIGTSSLGTVNEVLQFGSLNALRDALGTGPLVEAAAAVLKSAGGSVIVVKAPSSTAGAAGATTASRVGTSGGTVTGSGGGLDAYSVLVEILATGATVAAGTGTFRYSLDGGISWSPEISIPTGGTFVIPSTGITITFADTTGTSFEKGDKFAFAVTAPAYTLGELNTAIDALLADPASWFLLYVVGQGADASAAASIAGALSSKLAGAATAYRYARALMQAPDVAESGIKTAFASFVSTRVAVGLGFVRAVSTLTGVAMKTPVATLAAARTAAIAPGVDPSRVIDGALPGVVQLLRNEEATPGGDAARFVTARSFVGRPGSFLTNFRLMSGPTSDYRYIQHGRVMDIAAATVRQAQLDYLNDFVRVSSTTGRILEQDARTIESSIESRLRAALGSEVSAVGAQVVRTTNVLTEEAIYVDYYIVPLGYLKAIKGRIGFRNPALQQAAA